MNQVYSVIIVGLLISIMCVIILLNDQNKIQNVKGDDPPLGVSEEEELLSSSTPVSFSETECYNYIQSIQLISDLVNIEPPSNIEQDPNDEIRTYDDYSELIQDNRKCITYWNFILNKNNLNVHVDAETKQIFYIHNSLISNGEISMNDAIVIGQNIITTLAPEIGSITYKYAKQITLSQKVDQNGNIDSVTGYSLIYERKHQNIPTSDSILILLDSDGVLHMYSKTWNLEMPQDLNPIISENDGIIIAEEYLDTNNYITSELRIVRPNYYWNYEEERYGFTTGILCWTVVEWDDPIYTIINYGVYVDAITGDVVGGF